MADIGKLKPRRPSTLGAPPTAEEASENLTAPETAPPSPQPAAPPVKLRSVTEIKPARRIGEGRGIHDGRSRRRTGRTLQFATRVSEEFDTQLRLIADEEGALLVEVLERALTLYQASKKKR